MAPIGFIFLAIVVIVVIRLAAGGMDRDRVRDYIHSRGGRVIASNWSPFGKGWFGEKSDRIYEVRYLDHEGNEHAAHCKTSAMSGVYFTEDRITRFANRSTQPDEAPNDLALLAEENRQLREEVERLRRDQAG